MVTAYDAPQARLADEAGVDAILVGDSVGMTTLGYDTTLPVTLDDLLHHTRSVLRGQAARRSTRCPDSDPDAAETARGARFAMVITDLPFGSYGSTPEDGVRAGIRLVSEGGAQAVKLEGAGPVTLETIRRLVAIGVPVMGHLGMTPQSIHNFGGFKVQGKTNAAADAIVEAAQALVEAGAFGMVLEVIPAELAKRVTEAVPVPTIGIGAGPDCDGQVQVLHDLIGFVPGPVFKHARRYVEAGEAVRTAISEYAADVREHRFPGPENSF
jgi:3-methyl-2-oxobutanoate hydroxymethyltransferase